MLKGKKRKEIEELFIKIQWKHFESLLNIITGNFSNQ